MNETSRMRKLENIIK